MLRPVEDVRSVKLCTLPRTRSRILIIIGTREGLVEPTREFKRSCVAAFPTAHQCQFTA